MVSVGWRTRRAAKRSSGASVATGQVALAPIITFANLRVHTDKDPDKGFNFKALEEALASSACNLYRRHDREEVAGWVREQTHRKQSYGSGGSSWLSAPGREKVDALLAAYVGRAGEDVFSKMSALRTEFARALNPQTRRLVVVPALVDEFRDTPELKGRGDPIYASAVGALGDEDVPPAIHALLLRLEPTSRAGNPFAIGAYARTLAREVREATASGQAYPHRSVDGLLREIDAVLRQSPTPSQLCALRDGLAELVDAVRVSDGTQDFFGIQGDYLDRAPVAMLQILEGRVGPSPIPDNHAQDAEFL